MVVDWALVIVAELWGIGTGGVYQLYDGILKIMETVLICLRTLLAPSAARLLF